MTGKSPQTASGGDHLLIIRFSSMGDVAMLVPVIRVLMATYPNLKLTILTRGFFAPIFRDIPSVEVYAADLKDRHKGIWGLFRLFKELKSLGITGVADMHDVLRSNVLKPLFILQGIRFKQIDKGRLEKKALTAKNNKVFRQLKTTHQRYADVLEALGYPLDLNLAVLPDKYDLPLHVRAITGNKNETWIGIAPFAAHEPKAYPLTLLAEVLSKLAIEKDLKIFLFGGGHDETKKLESIAHGYDNIISMAGKLKFEEELDVISHLDLMVSMDSGNAHLAAMYGVKVLTIWGVTHPFAGFSAFNQLEDHHLLPDREIYPALPTSIYGNKYPAGYELVIGSISPEEVFKKIKRMVS